jgi:hypothetical protein
MRRLYFVLPDEAHAERMLADLEMAGIARGHVHAIAGHGAQLAHLPPATRRQLRDTAWRLEQSLWYANLALFAAALITCGWAYSAGRTGIAVVALAVAIASVTAGVLFAMRVPDTHLDEFRGALAHREILLMVDVPKERVAEIEDRIERKHPEAVAGGSGWTIEGFGI